MTSALADARYALRSWAKSPGFTLIAVASIGLGIGVTTAIFTLVDQVLLRRLPVKSPDELVQVTFEGSRYGSNWGDGSELSYPMYTALRDQNQVFSGMFSRFGFEFQVGESVQPERVAGELVSGSYFPVLGVRPALGRLLAEDDDRVPGGHPVAVLSHAFWTSRFGAEPEAVGRSLVVNGRTYAIVGVTEPGFEGIELGRQTQVFVPLSMKAEVTPGWNALDERLRRWIRVFGRLRPGVTPEQARASLEPIFRAQVELDLADREFANAAPIARQRYQENRLTLLPGAHGRSNFRRSMTTPLWVLMGTAAGVLLIACANVANLLLARAAARSREMAVRLALGATRGRLVRQLLVESLMLSLVGGLVGLALAAFAAPLVLALFVDPEVPSPVSTSPDLRILAFTVLLSTLTGVLFGLAPALQATRPDVAPTLKDQAGSVLGGGARLRKALVATQVAVSLLMLIGAGLFLRTLHNLLSVDVGFQTRSLVSFTVDPSLNGYEPEATRQFARNLLERLGTAPAVTAASLAGITLLEGNNWTSGMTIEGYAAGAEEDVGQHCNVVGPGYFRTMGIPLVRGREFDERDAAPPRAAAAPAASGAPSDLPPFRVAIVNERFARQYFGSADPVGRRIGFGSNPGTPTPMQIVGVVGDAKYSEIRDEVPRQVYFPYLEDSSPGGFTAYVRTSGAPEAAFAVAREAVRQLDPNLPVASPRTLEGQLERALSRERLVATMSALFGGLATLLSVVGLYGVMAYTVSRRTREIGVRIALGAGSRDIRWMVIREAMVVAAAGMAVAAPVAWWLSRLVASQLYGVAATDPTTAAGAVALLAVVSLLAGLVPSSRAARVQPTTALRYE
jgi:predicted permease